MSPNLVYSTYNLFFTQKPGWFSKIWSQIIPLPCSKLSRDFPSQSESIPSPNHGLESSSDQGPVSSLIDLHLSASPTPVWSYQLLMFLEHVQQALPQGLCTYCSLPATWLTWDCSIAHFLALFRSPPQGDLINTLSKEAPSAAHYFLILLYVHSWYLTVPKLQYVFAYFLTVSLTRM